MHFLILYSLFNFIEKNPFSCRNIVHITCRKDIGKLTYLFFLMGLVEVLENNGNVHVDYNHKINDNERDKVDD